MAFYCCYCMNLTVLGAIVCIISNMFVSEIEFLNKLQATDQLFNFVLSPSKLNPVAK